MKIAVASEHRGFKVKERILSQLKELGHEAIDFGPVSTEVCDYPEYAATAAQAVSKGEVGCAILIGGTGMGMCMVANKIQGVRAALCHDDLMVEISRSHNDANVLCLAADILGDRQASRMIELWLTTPFDGGRHARRNAKITEYERQIREGNRAL